MLQGKCAVLLRIQDQQCQEFLKFEELHQQEHIDAEKAHLEHEKALSLQLINVIRIY